MDRETGAAIRQLVQDEVRKQSKPPRVDVSGPDVDVTVDVEALRDPLEALVGVLGEGSVADAIGQLSKDLRENTMALRSLEQAYASPKQVLYDGEGRVVSVSPLQGLMN